MQHPIFRRLLTTLALALSIAVLGTSCASSSRLWRMSPLNGRAASDRVNLWPFLNQSGTGSAVLWPLFDVDDKGFALRPIAAKDGAQWEFLYPYSYSNSRSGRGWALPFYWTPSNTGLFPLANFGKFSFVGPFWWSRDGSGGVKSGGLFPLLYFGDTKYVGPIWWSTDSGGGVFPLLHFGTYNYLGPAWWNSNSHGFGLFPLFSTGDLRHVGPVWWRRKSNGTFAGGLFPLFWYDNGGDDVWILPFYGHSLHDQSRTRNYLLGLIHTGKSDTGSENWVMPLYYDRDAPGAADTVVFPVFWKRTREDRTQIYTLLGSHGSGPQTRSFNVYPLWWSHSSADASTKMLLPLFYYSTQADERTLLTPLGGRAWSSSGAARYLNVLGPVYHHSESVDGNRERTVVLWPFFDRFRESDTTRTQAAPFYSRTSTPDGSHGWYGLGLGHFQRTPEGSSHRLWPLYAVSGEARRPGFLYDYTLYGSRSHAGRSERHLFPLYSSQSSPVDSETKFLLGLAGYSQSDGRRSWRVWPFAAHSEHEDDSLIAHWTTLFGDARWRNHESFHIGGPLIYSSSTDLADGYRTKRQRVLTFFGDEQRDAIGNFVPLGSGAVAENTVHSREQRSLFGAFKRENREYRVWREGSVTEEEQRVLSAFSSRYDAVRELPRDEARARSILAEHGRPPVGASREELARAVAAFADAEGERLERHKLRLPLLYSRSSDGTSSEWSGPLWLITSKTEPQQSSFSLLYYGYRSETTGDETRRDIFPFITYDSSPRGVKSSFLWRVFQYRREGQKRGGHVLFIPWGDV